LETYINKNAIHVSFKLLMFHDNQEIACSWLCFHDQSSNCSTYYRCNLHTYKCF